MGLLDAVAQVVLPVAVATIMYCIGLGLDGAHFVRLLSRPKLLAVGLPCQCLLLPSVAMLLCRWLAMDGTLAAGLLLISACPTSAPANLLARLGRSNVAGSVALVAITAPAAALTIPAVLGIANYRLPHDDAPGLAAGLLWRTSAGVAVLATIPVAVGMLTRRWAPSWTRRAERPASRIATCAFAIGLTVAVASCWDEIPRSFRVVGLPALLLNVVAVSSAYCIARIGGVTPAERLVVVLGSTTRQFAVAGVTALTLCRDAELLIPAIAYCLIMWATAGASVLLARLRARPQVAISTA